MKLLTSLTISDQTRTCQVSAELELDNQVTPEMLSTRTSELLLGLQSGITNAVSGSTLKNVTPSANPPALVEAGPNENATQVTNPRHWSQRLQTTMSFRETRRHGRPLLLPQSGNNDRAVLHQRSS